MMGVAVEFMQMSDAQVRGANRGQAKGRFRRGHAGGDIKVREWVRAF